MHRPIKIALRYAIGLVLLFVVAGCGSKMAHETFLRPDVDLGYVETIAVLPFENNSSDSYAGERLRDITTTHLLARGLFDVLDKGIVDSAMKEEAIDPRAPLGPDAMKRLGQSLGAQALLLGTIDQLTEERRGNYSFPRLSLTFRLVDATAGTILWQATGSRSGATLGGRLFGTAPRDNFQVGRELVAELLATLPARPADLGTEPPPGAENQP